MVVGIGGGIGCITRLGNVHRQFVGFAILEGGINGVPDALQRRGEVANVVGELNGWDRSANKGRWVTLWIES